MPRYPTNHANAVTPVPLVVGERLKFDGDRRWWTVKAVTENFAVLTRQAAFHPADTVYYTVLDWRNGVRGPCDVIGQAWGDGTYTEVQCSEMLSKFEAGRIEVSQRNWVPIKFAALELRRA